jgi:hypothetical protein
VVYLMILCSNTRSTLTVLECYRNFNCVAIQVSLEYQYTKCISRSTWSNVLTVLIQFNGFWLPPFCIFRSTWVHSHPCFCGGSCSSIFSFLCSILYIVVCLYALKRLNSGSLLIYIWNGVKWIIHFLNLLKQPPRCHWISEKIHISEPEFKRFSAYWSTRSNVVKGEFSITYFPYY